MKTISIKQRVVVGMGLMIGFFILQAGIFSWAYSAIKVNVVETTRQNILATAELNQLGTLAQQIRRYEKEYFVYVANEEKRTGYEKEWTDTAEKISGLLQTMRQSLAGQFTKSDIAAIGEWTGAAAFYREEMEKIFGAVKARGVALRTPQPAAIIPPVSPSSSSSSKSSPAAITKAPEAAPVPAMFSPVEVNDMIRAGKDKFSGVLIKGVAAMAAEKTKGSLTLADVAADGFQALMIGVLATVVAGILLALVLTVLLPGAVLRPIVKLEAAVDAISKGKLDQPIQADEVLEFEGLRKAVERMRVAQQLILKRIQIRD